MKVKIFSWNVKGLNGDNKRRLVRNLIQQWGVDINVIVETKLRGSNSNLIQQLWRNEGMRKIHMEVIGRSGRIMVMWDKGIGSRISRK